MKTKMIIAATCMAISLGAVAGVKEKKAIKKLQTDTEMNVEKIRKECGNKNLTVEHDLDKYAAFMEANAKQLQTKHHVYEYANRTIFKLLYGLERLCKDADYKAEIIKLEKIKVGPNKNWEDRENTIKLSSDGKSIEAALVTSSSTPSSLSEEVQKLF